MKYNSDFSHDLELGKKGENLIKLIVEKVDRQCSPKITTLDVPGLDLEIWLCVKVEVRCVLFKICQAWSIHLI